MSVMGAVQAAQQISAAPRLGLFDVGNAGPECKTWAQDEPVQKLIPMLPPIRLSNRSVVISPSVLFLAVKSSAPVT